MSQRFSWQGEDIAANFAVLLTSQNCPLCGQAEEMLVRSGISFLVASMTTADNSEGVVRPEQKQLILRLMADVIAEGIKTVPVLCLFRNFPSEGDEPYDLFYNLDLGVVGDGLQLKGERLTVS